MTRDEELHCPYCGHVLARAVSQRTIATDEGEFRFSRRTDHILCDGCRRLVPIRDVREDPRDDALDLLRELAVDEDPPAAP